MISHRRWILSSLSCGLLFTALVSTGCGGDMSSSGLTLKNVPTGCPTTETAADLFTTVVQPSCALAGCHGAQGTSFSLSSAADLHAKWVGQKSPLYTGVSFPFVTAGNLDQSFVMYKITGSQGQNGSQMPTGSPALTSAQMCKFVAWIQSGAN